MIKKTGETAFLYINYKRTRRKTFDIYERGCNKLVFWQGGEFLKNKETGEYIHKTKGTITILSEVKK
jgi:hypothetical protein